MSEETKVVVTRQAVFHDGTSMIVLKPAKEAQAIDPRFVDQLVASGQIEAPKGWKAPGDQSDSIGVADGGGAFTAPEAEIEPPASKSAGKSRAPATDAPVD